MASQADASPQPADGQREAAADPFDNPSFDVQRYVNSMFPTESSLVELDPLVITLRQKVQRVDTEILAAVRAQSSSGARARGDLAGARASIQELFSRIHDIQRKAQQSELMVQEICRDIKKLDYAKKHLTATITALRRLSMLVNAVDQLQLSVERHEYVEAAHLLEAVQQLSSHFQSYVHIPKVAELKGRLQALERSLQINTLREFELLGEEAPSVLLLERLRSCCLVVEALGYQARDELIDSVCKREMGVYTQIFATIGDTARLERTVNRYKWLLKRLEARREIWAIFPPAWHVPQLLCIMFCNITKTMLAEILDLKSADLPSQVDSLLKAVEATNIFESEMARRFEGAVDRPPSGSEDAEAAVGAAPPPDDSSPAYRVRQRYEKLAREKQRTGEGESPERRKEQEHATSAAVAKTNFRGSISSVFVPYLSVYFEQVERDLMAGLERLVREEAWQPLSADLPVLASSNELVEALKGEMRDCTSRVTRGRPLLQLAAVFQRVYRAYAARLVARLPKPPSGSLAAAAVLGASDWQVRLSDEDIGVVCLIVSTAEHCQEMVRQLARALAAKLVPAELASRVDMSEEEDEFQTVITQCLAALLLGIEAKLEGALGAMARINWAAMDMAGDQSEYVGAFRRVLLDVGGRLGPAMPPNYFRFFCDKLLRSFAPRFLENVYRCKKISDVGCQQMRLDTEVIKGQLADLAKAGAHLDAAGVLSFAADVNAQLGRAEAVLKVVGSPPEGMVDTFFELLPHGSPSDFQRMADLKVLKRGEYQAVLEQFNRRMGRPLLSGEGAPSVRTAASGFALPQMQMPRLQSGTSNAAAKASAAAQDVATRLGKLNPNLTAAKASAAAAGESMRETMRGLKSKSLRFMQRD